MATAVGVEPLRDEHGYWVLRAALLVVDFLALAVSVAMYAQSDIWGYAMYGTLCSVVVHIPIILRTVPALSMWGVLVFVVTIGAGIRGWAIALGYPDRDVLTSLFTRGVPFDRLAPHAMLTVGCVVLLTLGFMVTVRSEDAIQRAGRAESPRGLTPRGASGSLFAGLVIAYSVVGAVGTILYFRAVGGLGASISDRRTTFTGEAEYASHGSVQFLAGAGVIALLLFLAYRLSSRKRWTPATWLALFVLVANAFAINWVTTTRADLLYVAFGVLLVVRLVTGRLSTTLVVSLALLVILGIGVLSQSRSSDDGVGTVGGLSVSVGVESGLLNRNAFDLSKTLHITNAVPEQLPLEYGSTIASYAAAPIPREVWPDKPVVSPGPIIGQTIYGLQQTGVPPGLVGELVWNFGRVPALFLSGVVGLALGFIQRKASAWSPQRVVLVLAHATVVLPFGKAIMGVALGQAFSAAGQAFLLLVPLLLIDRLLAREQSRREAPKKGSSRRSRLAASGAKSVRA